MCVRWVRTEPGGKPQERHAHIGEDLLTGGSLCDAAIADLHEWGWKVLQVIYKKWSNLQTKIQPVHYNNNQTSNKLLWCRALVNLAREHTYYCRPH